MQSNNYTGSEEVFVESNKGNSQLPEIQNWQLCFQSCHGNRNRINVLKAFYNYMVEHDGMELPVPGFCQVRGFIYGHELYADGEEFITGYVRKIHFINSNKKIYKDRELLPEFPILLGIETCDNHTFCVDYTARSKYMDRMKSELMVRGKLYQIYGPYVPMEYAENGYF